MDNKRRSDNRMFKFELNCCRPQLDILPFEPNESQGTEGFSYNSRMSQAYKASASQEQFNNICHIHTT